MTKVLILEKKTSSRHDGYDHVFSFRDSPADSHPEDYLTTAEADAIYEKIYDAMTEYVNAHPADDRLRYRDVDLLWCLKKPIFEQAYLAVLRYETLQRVLRKFPGSEFTVNREASLSKGPYLVEILGSAGVPMVSSICWTGETASDPSPAERKRMPSFVPSFLVLGDIRRQSVATCYDYRRSKNILSHLKKEKPILLSTSQPRRTILNALLHHFSLCQIHYRSEDGEKYQEISSEFVQKLAQETDLFTGFSFHGLHLQALLKQKALHIFKTALPKLLFEIDRFHDFFSRARSLKSILLDEDISPTRRALCEIARRRGVETFVECHGLLGGKHGFVPPAADRIFVWGREQKNKLMKWGCPEEKVIVSGNSRYFSYKLLEGKKIRRQMSRKFGLAPERPIILVAFPVITNSWVIIFEHKMQRIISEVLDFMSEVLKERCDVQFVIKLHPADQNKPFYYQWARQTSFPKRLKVIENYDPLLLAKAADFLIVYASTYAIDGFAMEKPVILVHDDSWFFEEFKNFPIFHRADDKAALKEAFLNLIQGPSVYEESWKTAREECLNESDKDPASFIAECIQQR